MTVIAFEKEKRQKPLILFICSGNSTRSQMAEAILRHYASDKYEAHSAGLSPKGVNPMAVRVLKEKGINTEGLRSKDVMEYLGKQPVRQAIIVCEKNEAHCSRIYPFAGQTVSWPFEDPSAYVGPEEVQLQKFRNIRDEIENRIAIWLKEQQNES